MTIQMNSVCDLLYIVEGKSYCDLYTMQPHGGNFLNIRQTYAIRFVFFGSTNPLLLWFFHCIRLSVFLKESQLVTIFKCILIRDILNRVLQKKCTIHVRKEERLT